MNNQQYQKLASEFIEMWQQQLATMVTDRQFIETMFAGLQQMANIATPSSYERPSPTQANDVDERLSKLEFRLDMAEERIRQLEAEQATATNTKPAAKRRKRASPKKVSKPAKRS